MLLQERHEPQARVFMYIKDPIYSGKVPPGQDSGRKFVEILGFRSVTTNLTMNGTGTATVTFQNFKGCLIRYVSDMDIKETETEGKGKETYNEYAKEFISKLCKDNTETYFRNLWNDTVVTRVNSTTELAANSISDFLSSGRTRGDVKDPPYNSADDVLKSSIGKKDVCVYALPFVNLFDPIFIDYIGQDGYWYAGFTGVVTSINENYPKTGDQAITIQCSDMNVLLDNSTLVVSWFNLPAQEKTIRDFVYKLEENAKSQNAAAFQCVFNSYKKVVDVIKDVIERAQKLWSFPDNTDVGTKGLYIDPIPKPYHGISARRGCIKLAGSAENVSPLAFNSDYSLTKDCYTTLYLEKGRNILIDPLITKFDNLFLHKLLANNLSLFNDLLKSPNDILNELVSRMIAYKYFDANGNLIIELAKPNNYPNMEGYGGKSVVTAIRHRLSKDKTQVEPDHVAILKNNTDWEKELGVNENDYDWLALNFHGKNYVLSQDDFIGFTSQNAEAPLVTVASTDMSGWAYINGVSANLSKSSSSLHGVAVADFDLLSKLGVKRYQAQSMYNVIWPSQEAGSRVLSFQSVAMLERINSLADLGTIQLNHRPELQLGRTIINPLRMKSYLITGITNSWSPGGMHTTTLTLTYGRPLHKTLETPWHAIFAERTLFGFLYPNFDDVVAVIDGKIIDTTSKEPTLKPIPKKEQSGHRHTYKGDTRS